MDNIANFLTQILNAQMAQKTALSSPYSKFKHAIADVLLQNGYLAAIEKKGREPSRRTLDIDLRYEQGQAAISGVKKVSKLGQRIYRQHKKIWPVKSGYGLAVISTSQGLMTDKQAKKKGLGGEIICEVW